MSDSDQSDVVRQKYEESIAEKSEKKKLIDQFQTGESVRRKI